MNGRWNASSIAFQALGRVLVAVTVAVAIGLVVGRVALVLIVVLALYLGIQIANLLRLDHWLRRRRSAPPPDISGPWGEVIATVSRIYRRKQFHKARVIRLIREFRRLTAAMPDGVVLLNSANQILWFNSNAMRWLRLRRKRDFGIRIENLVRIPDFVQYLNSSEPQNPVTIHEPGEGERWLEVHLVKTSNSEQKLLIVRDVTREFRVESMRRDFVANASHEMRSPLTVVTGYLDALAEDAELAAVWREPVGEMRRQVERMRAIIDDLLELSRLEAGKLPDEQIVDVAGLLTLIRREAAATQPGPAINLTIDTPARLQGAETELHSVFANLVSNAVKYTGPQGQIDIRWWLEDGAGHLSVRDTGIGIAREHIPRLTERFYRVDAGRSRKLGGSGLGLAIVKHVLQRHGATLTIESVEGKGSTFTCHFPPARIVNV